MGEHPAEIKNGISLNTWIRQRVQGSELDIIDLTTIRMMLADEGVDIEECIRDFSYPFRHLTTRLLKHDSRVLQNVLEFMHSVSLGT